MKALVCREDGFAKSMPDSAVLSDLGRFVEAREIDRPVPGAGEALIEVELASVNPSDEMFVQGLYGQPRRKGVPAGFEGVGRVVEVGSGLMGRWLKGKRVAFFARDSGSWADYALTGQAFCVPVSADLRDVDAAGFLVNPMTAYAMLGEVKGQSFVMSAAGSQLGKFMSSLARDRDMRPIGLVRRAEQIEPLKRLGAAEVLDTTADDYAERLRAVMREHKPRTFLDAVTGPDAKHVFDAMPDRAEWIVYGRLAAEPAVFDNPETLIFRRKRIRGFWLSDWFARASLVAKARGTREVQRRFLSGDWETDVTAVVPLDAAIARVGDELAKPDGKVFIRPNGA